MGFRDHVLADTLETPELRREFIEECERILPRSNNDLLTWACSLQVRLQWLIVALEVAERQLAEVRGDGWCTQHRRPFGVNCVECMADIMDANAQWPVRRPS